MYEYDELRIRIVGGGDGYRVLAAAPGAEVSGELRLPFSDDKLELYVLKLGRSRQGVRGLDSPEMGTAKELGSALFDALFTGDVRDIYQSALTNADNAGKGLRLTMLLSEVPELLNIPWEYLCDEGSFLAVSERSPIVRYLDLKRAHKPLPVELPIRLLGIVSSPVDLPPLDVEEEKSRLTTAVASLVEAGHLELRWLSRPTLGAMLHSLESETFHVLHYVGHGRFDETAQEGALMLEDETGASRPVTGDYLGQLLKDERSLQLAVLNTCEGGRTGRNDPFAGVAAALVRYEIPSVIAMQFEITDKAAITFAGGFYTALARGAPVDAALAAARRKIWADYNAVEWATPVLFMRVADGRIFDVITDLKIEPPRAKLEVALLADPIEVNAGDEVQWQLTITNAGAQSLADVAAIDGGGVERARIPELEAGGRSQATWRTRPEKDVDMSITVSAEGANGNRVSAQVASHATVRLRRESWPTQPPVSPAQPAVPPPAPPVERVDTRLRPGLLAAGAACTLLLALGLVYPWDDHEGGRSWAHPSLGTLPVWKGALFTALSPGVLIVVGVVGLWLAARGRPQLGGGLLVGCGLAGAVKYLGLIGWLLTSEEETRPDGILVLLAVAAASAALVYLGLRIVRHTRERFLLDGSVDGRRQALLVASALLILIGCFVPFNGGGSDPNFERSVVPEEGLLALDALVVACAVLGVGLLLPYLPRAFAAGVILALAIESVTLWIRYIGIPMVHPDPLVSVDPGDFDLGGFVGLAGATIAFAVGWRLAHAHDERAPPSVASIA